ncbi:uncharacterized protein PAN0_005c2532 [Moesziomyces antarcticus]|uniref:Uncharacterized protein n=2 Tax=Pseudozyma antarctica TaxID=84753 RepID=A0A081CCC4_PSEA2|nr:uncharacterized protein PAN0_005c2532 [Moesziomyces antarcticus]GAK64320.1 conserved hypothetical protein [Moesziomyces antarcticus]SPO45179.1 uncharacterized protein PSANT_02865 [Moesziomyces antarcticus]
MADQQNTQGATAAAPKRGHHRRTSSLLPSLGSLGSFLASAGGLATPNANSNDAQDAPRTGTLPTDAELVFSHPTPTEWADDSPVKSRPPPRSAPYANLSDEVRFRGKPQPQSSIAFPTPTSPAASASSSVASTPRGLDPDAPPMLYSPQQSSAASSADTPATSVRYSPRSTPKDMPQDSLLLAPTPPSAPPSESTTVKADAGPSYNRYSTLPRSFTPSRASPGQSHADLPKSRTKPGAHGRTSSWSATSGRRAAAQLDEALSSDEQSVQRQAGFRARSINSIRGLAAAFVPARFAPASQSSSSASSNDDASSLDLSSPYRRDELALVPAPGADSKRLVRHGEGQVKRPVKLDRRRLDKAVSLAVEAAQAAEEDERIWEQKRTRASEDDDDDKRDSDDDDDDLGFSLDLYISSLGYLISAISDKEAPGLSTKQRQDIKQRLEEGMSKLGFDARAELAAAEQMKQQLELERQKLQLERDHAPAPTANVVHHHYHTAVPASSSMFGDANFSRAHAAARASSKGSSSLAGKLSSSVLDIGLHIGAGALSALSANLSAIAPKGMRKTSGASSASGDKMQDPRITDLDSDEELRSPGQRVDPPSPAMTPSQPDSGAATPRTAWSRAISQNNKQWELAVAFASTAASALASSLGAVARSDGTDYPESSPGSSEVVLGPLTLEQQQHLARYGHPEGAGGESAEDRLILLSASLARALKRSPLPTQLYQLLRQMVSILAAIDAKYRVSEKGTQLALRETSRALRFVRRHDLHVKAVRVAWAAAEAAVAALEAYRDEPAWAIQGVESQQIAAPARRIEDQFEQGA